MRGPLADRDALLDILEYSEKARHHTMGGPTVLEDEVTQAAMLRWLGVIGEAANRVSLELRDRHPQVPWAGMVGMRNLLVHRYDTIRNDLVWDAIQKLADLEWNILLILDDLPE